MNKMKKSHLFHTSASVIATGFMLAATVAHATPGTTVVNGNSGTGFVISDAVSHSNNPGVINSNSGQVSLDGASAVSGDQSLSVGDDDTITVFTNFYTKGGAGSGGGGGLGGVFFIDQGQSLTLNNVAFISNVAKGGQGGSYQSAQVASTIVPLNNYEVEVIPTLGVANGVTVSQNGGNYYITDITLLQKNDLFASGASIRAGSNVGTAIIASVSGNSVSFANGGMLVDPSNVHTVNTGTIRRGDTVIDFGSDSTVQSMNFTIGGVIFGSGIAAGTSVEKIIYNNNGTVARVTLNKAVEGVYWSDGENEGYADISSVSAISLFLFEATTFKSISANSVQAVGTPISGVSAGMEVTVRLRDTSTLQTTVTNVASDGTITFGIDVTGMVGFKASSTAATAGSNVLTLSSTSGLVAGMSVSGVGIPTGTVITAINGNHVTLSNALNNDVTAAIESKSMFATFGNVLGINTSAKTVTLGSVAGLKVGQIITGAMASGSAIPDNAVITGINASTGVVTYKIVDGANNLTTGGSMNGLISSGSGSTGYNGQNGGMWNTTMHDGEGESGLNGGNGDDGNAGQTGGQGGNGGSGTRALPYNLDLMDAVLSGSIDVAGQAAEIAAEAMPDPFPKIGMVSVRSLSMGFAIKDLIRDSADLAAWQVYLGLGLVGHGGDGSAGGNGGDGSTFFGGGAGGAGGNGGDSATSRADGGAGGDGGSGGEGGFGAGGGSGGSGGKAGWGGTTSGGANANGDGGDAGFGAGAGASAGNGGDGGSGYGGAIFVRDGGNLTITGNALFRDNSVLAGSGGTGKTSGAKRGASGDAAGTDLFMMKGSQVVLAPGDGNIIRFEGSIADDSAASIDSANWASGEGADIVIVGGGLVQFAGENTYTGHTIIAGATLEADDGMGINNDSNIQFAGLGTVGQGTNFSNVNGGVWLTEAEEVVRRVGTEAGQISWVGSGGFAAGDNGLLLNFGAIDGHTGQALVWNDGSFVPNGSTLMFGSEFGTGTVTLANNVNLAGNNGKIAVYDNAEAPDAYAVMAGNWSNGTLTVNDTNYSGALVFTGQNSLSGMTVNHGLVTTALLDEDGNPLAQGRLMNAVSGGNLTITGAATVELYSPEKLNAVDVAAQGTLLSYSTVNSGNITNHGTIGFGGSATSTDNIVNDGDMVLSGAVSTGTVQNTGGLALLGTTVSTGAITNAGSDARLLAVGSTSIATGNVVNDAALLMLRSDSITTGNITNTNAGELWLLGNGTVDGTMLNDTDSNLYLAGDFTADSRVTNYGTMYIVGALGGDAETGATTRKLYTTGLWDPNGVFQLGGLNGTLANVFEVHQSGNSTNSGTFTGAGSLVFTGGGLMNMTGASDFTGGFTITGGSSIDTTDGGTLADTLAITVADSASHLTLGTADVIGSITNAGLVDTNAAIGLTGDLTNTGTVNVNFVGSAASLDVAGNVANNGGTINLASDTVTLLQGNLTNSGTLNNAGGSLAVFDTANNQAQGTLNLQADSVNTFAALTNSGTIDAASEVNVLGAYVQNAGLLTTIAALNTGSLSGTGGAIVLDDDAVYTVNQTANGTYAGTISGSGSVVKTGSATLTLAGAVDSFAPTSLDIRQGTVAVDGAGILEAALSVGVSSGATLSLVTGNQTIHNLSGSGLLSLNGNDLYLAQGGDFAGTVTGSGNVQVTSGVFNLSNTINSTLGNFQVLANSAMNVASTGTLNAPTVNVGGSLDVQGIVNSTTNNVTGLLHLGNGNGSVAGTLASTTTNVNGGGTLSGVGLVTGSVIVGGSTTGTLRPGNSPGVMAIANLTLDNNSVTEMEIEGNAGAGLSALAGGYDQMIVTGTLTLKGGSLLQIANSNAYELGLGDKVKIFNFAPGAVSGHFGSVTSAFGQSVAYNLATGSVVGLGSYSPSSFETAIAHTPNEVAMLGQVRVSTAGGVTQYYGGRLIEFASNALASGNTANVAAVFDKASPEAYTGLMDHMKLSMLNNRLELGGYETVDAPTYFMTGSIGLDEARSSKQAGYLRYKSNDHRFNIGAVAQWPIARLQMSYGRTDGRVESPYMRGDVNGDQFSAGASVPVAVDGALRLAARFAYGDYTFKGTRVTNAGTAAFGGVRGNSTVFGGGFEYFKTSKRLSIAISSELLSVLNKIKRFTETGVGELESLSVHAQRDRFEMLSAKLKLGYEFQPGIQGYMGLSLDQDLQNRLHTVSANVRVEDVNMTVANPGFVDTRFDASLGAKVDLTDAIRWTIEGNVGNASHYGGKTSISIRF